MATIVLITDSTCDLPADMVQRYGIRVVPTYVQFGQESLADDGVELTRPGFYRRLVTDPVHPTTSAPSLGQAAQAMTQGLEDAEHVIAITAAASLSSIHNIFLLAAKQTDPDRISVIDSRTLSMGLGWLVQSAAEMIQQGMPPAGIVGAIEAMKLRADMWAALDTMEYLRRSGRVGWAAAMIGQLLQIKPIVRLYDGAVSSAARARTTPRAFATLVYLAHQAAPFERLAILHTNNLDGAHRFAEAVADIQPDETVPIVDVTPVIGVHVGPSGIGLGVIRQHQP
jgi:DegV family protein with EDD domain